MPLALAASVEEADHHPKLSHRNQDMHVMTAKRAALLALVTKPSVTPAWQTYDLTVDEHREAAATYRMVERRCRDAAANDPSAAEAVPWFAERADWHSRQAMTSALRALAAEAGDG
ncbi:hypothetical protein KPL78_19355 [Roseomonas sp. HJA6]|uniref:4a-hydroxytetrahydrobiopterin dehydratase n=1 Tax=Roseomonas alba TaxID=2846776 RepID=A0ABS7ACI9_9PROT|nr:hypothetical protein [Neoroseomonas alba]MBW6400027.1 hypothetical protein [Neoroseomonas alba]